MANPEHLARLKKGAAAWNQWRWEYPEVLLDLAVADLAVANLCEANLAETYLAEANLALANLFGANLFGANLTGANLTGANLFGANLFGANLTGADLTGANLAGANLTKANLTKANLSKTDLFRADLYGANLTGANLTGANLTGANVTWTNFTGADLTGGNLTGGDLTGANLTGANLTGANLTWGNLTRADLTGANLTGGNLTGANLTGANLTGAHIVKATINLTSFPNIDLSRAKGLELVVHLGPSSIGVDTLLRSAGRIPDGFLLGCGYDPVIQQMLVGDEKSKTDAFYEWLGRGGGPLKLQSCFISYSTSDLVFVHRLQAALNDRGVDYWYAPEHGRWGEELEPQIDREIHRRDRLILVCSATSLYESTWVQHEIDQALAEEKKRGKRVIFPVMLDDSLLKWADPRAKHILDVLAGDFRKATRGPAFEAKLGKLLEGLQES